MFQVLPANPSPLRVMPFSSAAITVIPYRVLPDGVQAAVSDRLCLAARRTRCPPDEKAWGSSDWRAAPRARPAVGCSAPVFGGFGQAPQRTAFQTAAPRYYRPQITRAIRPWRRKQLPLHVSTMSLVSRG